jgi:hypothetical protein
MAISDRPHRLQTHLCDLAAGLLEVDPEFSPSDDQRAQGMPGADAPAAARGV